MATRCDIFHSLGVRLLHSCPVVQAFAYAQQVVAGAGGNVIPRLRDFHPALVGYALTGNADKAGEVIRCMMEHCKPGDLTGVLKKTC
jgi:hypothetical protein